MEIRIHSWLTVDGFHTMATIFNNKYDLECHSFGTKVLSLHRDDNGDIRLAGLPDDAPEQAIQAYKDYLNALMTFASQATRVNHRAPAKGTSEKYAFRTWLNRIGLKGPQYKATRKALLANLTGSTTRAN